MTDSLVITAPGNLSDPSAATPRRLTAFPGDIAPTRRWVASQLAKLPGDTVQPWPDLTGGYNYLGLERMSYYVNKDAYRRAVRAAAAALRGDARESAPGRGIRSSRRRSKKVPA